MIFEGEVHPQTIATGPVYLLFLFPLHPIIIAQGGGIFWTAYHLVANHLTLAATIGFTALKVTITIACGIVLATAIGSRTYHELKR